MSPSDQPPPTMLESVASTMPEGAGPEGMLFERRPSALVIGASDPRAKFPAAAPSQRRRASVARSPRAGGELFERGRVEQVLVRDISGRGHYISTVASKTPSPRRPPPSTAASRRASSAGLASRGAAPPASGSPSRRGSRALGAHGMPSRSTSRRGSAVDQLAVLVDLAERQSEDARMRDERLQAERREREKRERERHEMLKDTRQLRANLEVREKEAHKLLDEARRAREAADAAKAKADDSERRARALELDLAALSKERGLGHLASSMWMHAATPRWSDMADVASHEVATTQLKAAFMQRESDLVRQLDEATAQLARERDSLRDVLARARGREQQNAMTGTDLAELRAHLRRVDGAPKPAPGVGRDISADDGGDGDGGDGGDGAHAAAGGELGRKARLHERSGELADARAAENAGRAGHDAELRRLRDELARATASAGGAGGAAGAAALAESRAANEALRAELERAARERGDALAALERAARELGAAAAAAAAAADETAALRERLRRADGACTACERERAELRARVAELEARVRRAEGLGYAQRIELPRLAPEQAARMAERTHALARAAVARDGRAADGARPRQLGGSGGGLLLPGELTAGKSALVPIPPAVVSALDLEGQLQRAVERDAPTTAAARARAPGARAARRSLAVEPEHVVMAMLLAPIEGALTTAVAPSGPPPPQPEGVAVAVREPGGAWALKFQVAEPEGDAAMDVRAYGMHELTLATLDGTVAAKAAVLLAPPERVRPSARWEFFDALNNERITPMSYVVTDAAGRQSLRERADEIVLQFGALPDGITRIEVSSATFETAHVRFLKFGGMTRKEAVDSIFFNRAGTLLHGQMRVVLSWSDRPADLDLHCVSSKGGHVYWAQKEAEAGRMRIDVDVTRGQGPETLTLDPTPGRSYRVFVHNYTASKLEHAAVDDDLALSIASVQLFDGTGAPPQRWEVPTNPVENRLYWDVFTVFVSEDKTVKIEASNELLTLRPDKPLPPGQAFKNATLVAYAASSMASGHGAAHRSTSSASSPPPPSKKALVGGAR
ncbi:hypothetical protein KFE25_011553 [Diacronema lutheri]|uniref:Uncharacterized protein n=1 Tax=Diacronema lutheri TaxID=2081491 RepID=A0A8J5XE14_DIALT|nr:hypothetical protein KFE25_011553 [Diacronema lutheri]